MSAYAIDDLLHQQALLASGLDALERIRAESVGLRPVIIVGAPLPIEGGLFNCAVIIHRGRLLGIVPKSYLPEYREYYEKRQFRAAATSSSPTCSCSASACRSASDLLFCCSDVPAFVLFAEICEDFWAPIPVSTYGALAGATVIANLSASNITIGKADFRRLLCASIPRARSRVTCSPRPGSANRPPTWPGTDRRSSTRTATSSPRRIASPTPSS